MNTTTQPQTANVMVEKRHGLGNQQPSLAQAGKVQRPERKLVGTKRSRSAGHLFAGEDMVRSASRDAVGGDKLTTRKHSGFRLVEHPCDEHRIRRQGNAGRVNRPRQLVMVGCNSVNCWNTLRAVNTTAQVETPNAMVQEGHGLGNQHPSSVQEKDQRLGSNPVGTKRSRSAERLFERADEDIARTVLKGAEECWKRAFRNITGAPAPRRLADAS